MTPASTSNRFLLLALTFLLSGLLGAGRLHAEEAAPQNTVVRFEGLLTPLNGSNAPNGDWIIFDVTYDPAGKPIAVDYEFALSSLVLNQEQGPLCATGGQGPAYKGQTINLQPWPGGKAYTWLADERPGGTFPTQVAVEGLLGLSLNRVYIGPKHSQGAITAFYEVSIGGAPSFTIPCNWTWAISNGPGGILSFSESKYEVGENEGSKTITVVRKEITAGEVTVDYITSDSTAEAGKDYSHKEGTLVFKEGETQKTFTVDILPDNEVEGLETLNLTLQNQTEGALLGAPNPAVLEIDDRPDLTVLPYTLDAANLVQEGTKFIFKQVPVRVTNLQDDNGGTVPSTTVELKGNGTVIDTVTVGPLAPGTIQTFNFDWDVTSFLLAGGGIAQLNMTARIDPGNSIEEREEGNNTWPAGMLANVLPVIDEIKPQYQLDGKFFIRGASISNKIEVTVMDWNGQAQGQGVAPFGKIHYQLNGDDVIVPGQIGKMNHTYDMGTDFSNASACHKNILNIWAEGIHPSFVTEPGPPFISSAVNEPEWVTWVKANLENSDVTFTAKANGELIDYEYSFFFPNPKFGPHVDVPGGVPFFGGHTIGFDPPTAASIGTSSSSGGPGKVLVEGQTSFKSPQFTGSAEIKGSGATRFRCLNGVPVLAFEEATLGYTLNHSVPTNDIPFAVLMPQVTASLAAIPYIGPGLAFQFGTSKLSFGSSVGGGLSATFRDKGSGELDFDLARGQGQIDVTAGTFIHIANTTVSVTGGGTALAKVKVPRPPIDYLEQVGIGVSVGASVQTWGFSANFTTGATCTLPGGCSITARTPQIAASSGWQTMPPMQAGPDYALFRAEPSARFRSPRTSESETILVSNVYTYPAPALAVDAGGKRLLAYVHEDPAAPRSRSTEIRTLHWNGSAWQAPVAVTSDSQPDYNPALAYDGNGNGVLVWERSTLAPGISPSLDVTFTQSLEIFTSQWNGSSWTAPAPLTNNGLMDSTPLLARGSDGTVVALWQQGNGDTLGGTSTNPVDLMYAVWNGTTWSAPAQAIADQVDLRQTSLAAGSATDAALVLSKGDPARTGNAKLHYSTFDGINWSGLQTVTNSAGERQQPSLVYDSNGVRNLIWLENGEVRWLKNSWSATDATAPFAAVATGAINELALVAGPGGSLAMTWQGDLDGKPGIVHALYETGPAGWSAPVLLLGDEQIESAISPEFAADGDLHVSYRKTTSETVTKTVTLDNNQQADVPNVLVLGKSDLAYATVAPKPDLTFDTFTVTPANPAPGQQMTLVAVLRNADSKNATTPRVRFLDGTTALATQDLADLAGGSTQTVTVQAALGPQTGAHTLKVVADPDGQLAESDESNNERSLVTSRPDLRSAAPVVLYSSAKVTVTAVIHNDGTQATGAGFTVELRADEPVTGTKLAEVQLPALGAGGQTTALFVIDSANLPAADETILWIVADAAQQIAESDEENNTTKGILWNRADLSIAASDVAAGSGSVQATIHNRGTQPAASIAVWFGTGNEAPTDANAFHKETISSIPAGGSLLLNVPATIGLDPIAVYVDPQNAIAESVEANNLVFRQLTSASDSSTVYLPFAAR